MSLEKFSWCGHPAYMISRDSVLMWGDVFKHLFSLSLMAGIMPWGGGGKNSLRKTSHETEGHRQTMTGQRLNLDGRIKLSKMFQDIYNYNIQWHRRHSSFCQHINFYNLFLWWVLEINDDIVFIPSCRTLSEKLISFFKPHDIQFV